MKLIVSGVAETLVARLVHAGWQGERVDGLCPAGWQRWHAYSQDKEAALWLHAGTVLPKLRPGDLLIHAGKLAPTQLPKTSITLAWQDSPFAAQYGFLLAAGGAAEPLRRAQHLLDALAPMPGGWLHAGGLSAPQFLTDVAQELGGGLLGLAGLMQAAPELGFNPLLQGQQQLLSRISKLAQDYLDGSTGEEYQAVGPAPALFAFPLPNSPEEYAPARKLARLLIWLQQHGAVKT